MSNNPIIINFADILEFNKINIIDHEYYIDAIKQFILYSMHYYNKRSKHQIYANKIVMIHKMEFILDIFVRILNNIDNKLQENINFKLYDSDFLLIEVNNESSLFDKIVYIHSCFINIILKNEITKSLNDIEYIYALDDNYRYQMKINGLDKIEHSKKNICNDFRNIYNYYRFIKEYGKLKSVKKTFKDIVFIIESKRLSNILNDSKDECPICLEPIYFNSRITNCYHVFHNHCIQQWAQNCIENNIIPNCCLCKTQLN